MFEYESLYPVSNGTLLGLFYFSPSDYIPALSAIGVSASDRCIRAPNVNISPGESLPCPPLGSPNQGWCFSKARVEINTKLQLCKTCGMDDTCLGILLIYSDDTRDALGEIRFDRYLSEKVDIQACAFSNQMIDGKLHVLVRTPPNRGCDWASDEWYGFPTAGKIVWWCGPNGNQIGVPKDERQRIALRAINKEPS